MRRYLDYRDPFYSQVVINSCGCQRCRDCPDREARARVVTSPGSIDQELLLSVVRSKYPHL